MTILDQIFDQMVEIDIKLQSLERGLTDHTDEAFDPDRVCTPLEDELRRLSEMFSISYDDVAKEAQRRMAG